MKYVIRIIEEREECVIVEAENESEAISKTKDAFYNNKIVMDSCGADFYDITTEDWRKSIKNGKVDFLQRI